MKTKKTTKKKTSKSKFRLSFNPKVVLLLAIAVGIIASGGYYLLNRGDDASAAYKRVLTRGNYAVYACRVGSSARTGSINYYARRRASGATFRAFASSYAVTGANGPLVENPKVGRYKTRAGSSNPRIWFSLQLYRRNSNGTVSHYATQRVNMNFRSIDPC